MDDAFLIHQVLSGNRNAFRLLVVRYQRALFRFLRGFRLSDAIVEELAQESFLRAYRSLDRWDGARSSFASWLLTIARNLALHELERAGHRRELPVESVADLAPPEPSAPPQRRLEEKTRAECIRKALERIPAALQRALVLAYVRELSLEEAAAIEDCPIGTIKSRIFRGKQLLRAALNGTEV